MEMVKEFDTLRLRRFTHIYDDFHNYTDAQLWTKGGTSATIANSDGDNGILTLTTNTAANAEAWVASTRKNFTFGNNAISLGKAFVFESRINYQEANGTNGGLFVGFSSAFATALLVNGTLTPATSMSCAGFYLAAGATNWNVITSIGATQTLSQCAQLAGNAADQILRVEVHVVGTNIEVVYLVDTAVGTVGSQQVQETASGFKKPIKHRMAFSGAAAMAAGVFVKGASTTAEVLKVDYVDVSAVR